MSKSSGADAAAERRDHRLDFVAAEHLVEAGLLDVQDLALERQDRLEAPIASLLGRSAGRLALDDVELAERRIALLAVGELAWQRAAVERALPPHQIARLARGLARAAPRRSPCRSTVSRDRRVLLEVRAELVVDDRLDDPLDLGVAEFGLRLPSNCGCGIFTLMTAVSPSRMSSPVTLSFEVLREVVLASRSS